MIRRSAIVLLYGLLAAACTPVKPTRPVAQEPVRPGMPEFTGGTPLLLPAPTTPDDAGSRSVRATILPGTAPAVGAASAGGSLRSSKSGDISVNFPGADPRAVAQAVLGDVLHLPYRVDAAAVQPVTLVTTSPVARSALFALFEDALHASGLAVVRTDNVFVVTSLDAARSVAGPSSPDVPGFGTEVIRLQFVNADEMRRLLEPVLPGVVTASDPVQNSITVSGTSGQRTNVRDLLRQFDVNWLRNMSFGLFVPQRTDARLIVPELDKLLNAPGAPTANLVRLIAMERLNGILAITGQRQYLDDVRRWVEVLDREGESNERRLFVYRVQNGRSRDLVKTINAAFGRSGGSGERDDSAPPGGDSAQAPPPASVNPLAAQSPQAMAGQPPVTTGGDGRAGTTPGDQLRANITSDEANNSIVIFGTQRDYAVIEDALRKLDVAPQQVMIEAAITEVTLNDDMRYGVQWNFDNGNSNFALSEGTTAAPVQQFPGFSYFYAGHSISASLNALEQRTHINVISAPKLLVLNNQTASLQVGDQVPVATQSAVGVVTSSSAIVNSIEYRDTGVILRVTPRVNSGGLVLLDISQEVSAVSPATTTTSATTNSPTITTRRISTSIAVQDGQVIALGGLIKDSRTRGRTGLPYLSRLPVVGGLLFGRTENTEDRTELLVLLKPHVIRSADDASAVTDELRAKIRTVPPFQSRSLP